jgi:DNA polymerase sigma
MSELIYIMTKLDSRFTTLLFAIRSWASARKITNPVPGRQPTNFMFVLLLIYFMQHKKVLPTLDVLFNNPGNLTIINQAFSIGFRCTQFDSTLSHLQRKKISGQLLTG